MACHARPKSCNYVKCQDLTRKLSPFDEAIEKAIDQCKLLVVIIGRNWLARRAAEGPRINDPKDFVRMEIAAALSRNIPVIPVLLDGTTMPTEEELPESLRAMRKRSGVDVSHNSFRSDMDELISAAKRALGEPMVPPKPPGTGISPSLPWRRRFAVYSLVSVLAAGALTLIIYAYRKPPSPPDWKPIPPKPAVSPSPPSVPEESGKESEPNNSASSANTILFGGRVQGVIKGDLLDVFRFKTPVDLQGKTRLILRKLSSWGFAAEVTIYDKNEQRVAGGGARDDTPVSFVFDAAPSSTYFVYVKSVFQPLMGEGPYELEIRAD